MDIILIPGLWLDGSSWDEVVPALERAGHRTLPLTLPGMESKDADRSGITLRDLVDLDDKLRAAFRERAIPSPARVASDRQQLSDERRYDVPATVIACEFSSEMLRNWMEQGVGFVRELGRIRDVGYINLPTGHW